MVLSRRSFLGQAGLATLALRGGLLRALEGATPTTVHAPCGALGGEKVGAVRVFRGVPFAEAPVGTLRFRAPEAVKPWKGLRDATRFAAAAMQPGVHFPVSEDCLYLNIWAPEGKGPFPVYVWIHGGGFTGGRAHDPMFDGAMLAEEGVVCVTVAYRLGVLGFLNMEPLLGARYEASANNGLRDLMCALSWVKENIAAFGGDAARVTIGGQSAGAKLTDLLMSVPAAKGLFHQMVSESGGGDRYNQKAESERIAEGFGALWKSLGAETRELTTAPAEKLIAAQAKFMASWPKHFPLRAEIDGKLLPAIPVETITAGSTRGKRLLLGTCLDESAAFIGTHPQHDATAAELGNLPASTFLTVYGKYKNVYPQVTEEQRRIRALTAEEYWIPSMRVAEAHVKGGGEAWVYRLDFAETMNGMHGFALHSMDVKLVWDRPNARVDNAADEARLAAEMHGAWVEFLKGRTPAAKGLPAWPEFTAKKRATMILNAASRVEEHPAEAELRLWDGML
ncbi:MAG: carboxylesterase family protein [Terracidiphilus sp.]|nr:carboxylesterase family protein [Terracidiphilus sp.]